MFSAVWIQCTNVSDRQTDTGQRLRLRITSRGKNAKQCAQTASIILERNQREHDHVTAKCAAILWAMNDNERWGFN